MVDVEGEIKFMMQNCEPRHQVILTDGYGLRQLRTYLKSVNENIKASESKFSYQGNFYGLYLSAIRLSELEFALGYPIDRIRFFFQLAAKGMLTCLKMRGTLERVEFTVDCDRGQEKLVDASAYVDVSMGKPHVGIDAHTCAWLAQDLELAQEILAVINFHPEDTKIFGAARIAEMRARIALLQDNEEVALEWLERTTGAEYRERLIRGLVERNQELYNLGLSELLKFYEKEEKKAQRDMGDYFKKKGLKNPPVHYMYIEPLGAALLGLKRGLDLEVEHHFLPVEILEGCV